MSRTRYRIFDEGRPHFMTGTVVAWLPVFAYPDFVDIILESWRFLQRERGVRIYGYVVMENHLHWIATADDLSQKVGQFKSYTARAIIDRMAERGFSTLLDELRYFKLRHKIDQEFQLWQEGSHPQEIDSDDMFVQKLEYMHNNPMRRRYVDDPMHWCYSSARNYAGMKGLLDVITDWR